MVGWKTESPSIPRAAGLSGLRDIGVGRQTVSMHVAVEEVMNKAE